MRYVEAQTKIRELRAEIEATELGVRHIRRTMGGAARREFAAVSFYGLFMVIAVMAGLIWMIVGEVQLVVVALVSVFLAYIGMGAIVTFGSDLLASWEDLPYATQREAEAALALGETKISRLTAEISELMEVPIPEDRALGGISVYTHAETVGMLSEAEPEPE